MLQNGHRARRRPGPTDVGNDVRGPACLPLGPPGRGSSGADVADAAGGRLSATVPAAGPAFDAPTAAGRRERLCPERLRKPGAVPAGGTAPRFRAYPPRLP